ncbi:hypothetical protein [Teichococcus aestuarii]|uniref:hypothetical protein n=1 Tax=Teichococcus aestuarii TaxID=568898 RepID=UPI0036149656
MVETNRAKRSPGRSTRSAGIDTSPDSAATLRGSASSRTTWPGRVKPGCSRDICSVTSRSVFSELHSRPCACSPRAENQRA